ncbi:MAG: hypothetical protein ACOYL0_15860 [Limnohabitans sp.]
MKPYKIKLGAFLLASCLSFPACANWVQQLSLASSKKHFIQPSADEAVRAQVLFLRLLKNDNSEEVKSSWAALGFDLVNDAESGLTLLIEQPTQRRGRGFFAFRKAKASALQIPHSFKDEMTREIGITLFQKGSFSAAAWNTVPRNFILNGVSIDADMAHLTDTYFIAFSRAFAQLYPQGNILQLHGFEQGKRRNEAAKEAAAILSNGTRIPPPVLRDIATCLAKGTGANILSYPYDVHELGATTNTIAAALRQEGFDKFFHLEMSRDFRTELQKNVALQKMLLHCFTSAP